MAAFQVPSVESELEKNAGGTKQAPLVMLSVMSFENSFTK